MKEKTNSLAARMVAILSAFLAVALVGITLSPTRKAVADRKTTSDSASRPQSELWSDAQTVTPADLVKEIADTKSANKPVVVCAGVRVLYEGAHVPGAVFHGPASTPQGMADLKKCLVRGICG